MGTGKTTIGRALSQRLGYGMLDVDQEIEQRQGRTIADIFAKEGEPAFRAMERAFIEHGHPSHGHVIACGGGLIIQPGMLELLRSKGVVLCLHASLETILRRTAGLKHRPLLNVDDQAERIRILYTAREPIYKRAGTTLLTDLRPMGEIVQHAFRIYKREAEEFRARVAKAGVGAARS